MQGTWSWGTSQDGTETIGRVTNVTGKGTHCGPPVVVKSRLRRDNWDRQTQQNQSNKKVPEHRRPKGKLWESFQEGTPGDDNGVEAETRIGATLARGQKRPLNDAHEIQDQESGDKKGTNVLI